MFLGAFNTIFSNVPKYPFHLEETVRYIQIEVTTSFVVLSNVGIKMNLLFYSDYDLQLQRGHQFFEYIHLSLFQGNNYFVFRTRMINVMFSNDVVIDMFKWMVKTVNNILIHMAGN